MALFSDPVPLKLISQDLRNDTAAESAAMERAILELGATAGSGFETRLYGLDGLEEEDVFSQIHDLVASRLIEAEPITHARLLLYWKVRGLTSAGRERLLELRRSARIRPAW
jgi:hypothetical protein